MNKTILLLIACLTGHTLAAESTSAKQQLRFHVAAEKTPLVNRTEEILQRRIQEQCGIVPEESAADATLILAKEPGIGEEGFRISEDPDGKIRITGNDDRGLLYGVGKFLHTSRYEEGRFTPSAWRGTSVPDCHVRGMYWAFHNNFYPNAPLPELNRYMEDLALWGVNALVFHFSPKAENNAGIATADEVAQFRSLFREAKKLGLSVGLIAEPNMGRSDAPKEILAEPFPDTNPQRRGTNGTRICPSKPEGFTYLSKMLGEYLDHGKESGLDYVIAFPYDSGGCGCKECWPWGGRGYLKISREFFRLARERFPQAKRVVGTWCFDVRSEPDGEYDGLSRELEKDNNWADYIMDDSHGDYPRYFLDHGVAGGLPLLNFAEISMWGRFPWGGSGANPLPERFQRIWDQSGKALDGGFPYSEGKYDDINKVIFSQFFWNRNTKAVDAVREYVSAEYSPVVVEPVTEAILLLEKTYQRGNQNPKDIVRAYELLQGADAKLSQRVRESWRWRMLLLRATIDFELSTHNQQVTDRCNDAYEELIRISHLETGWTAVKPPARPRTTPKAPQPSGTPLPPGSDSGIVPTPTATPKPPTAQ